MIEQIPVLTVPHGGHVQILNVSHSSSRSASSSASSLNLGSSSTTLPTLVFASSLASSLQAQQRRFTCVSALLAAPRGFSALSSLHLVISPMLNIPALAKIPSSLLRCLLPPTGWPSSPTHCREKKPEPMILADCF